MRNLLPAQFSSWFGRGFGRPKTGEQFVGRDASRRTFEAGVPQLSRQQLASERFELRAVHQLIEWRFMHISERFKEPAARPDVAIGLHERLIPRVETVPRLTRPRPCVDRPRAAVDDIVIAQL
jgi:hypothetical protein